ncbi:MAG: methyltransferase domain-containing protein [Hyphomicrobiales bacterium]|nr:methyltransferase domain-containing protein [Hyphomicrobiales bacterium]
MPDLALSQKKILHFAPEHWLFNRLKTEEDYIGGDIIKRKSANAVVDITNIIFPDKYFDVIICNHVLEHVDEDSIAIAECFRVLSDDGFALFTVPIDPSRQNTWEPPETMSTEEVEKICGWDHKRLYGLDIVNRFQDAGFHSEVIWFTQAERELYRLFNEPIFFLSKNNYEKYRRSIVR